jgi:hypothetical protein
VLRPYSPEQKLSRLPIQGTAELARRSTSRCLQPLKSTLDESLIIPATFPANPGPPLAGFRRSLLLATPRDPIAEDDFFLGAGL